MLAFFVQWRRQLWAKGLKSPKSGSSPLPQMSLNIFGYVLKKHRRPKSTEVTILTRDKSQDGEQVNSKIKISLSDVRSLLTY